MNDAAIQTKNQICIAFFSGLLRFARNDGKRSGNAIVLVLIGVALFGALAYTFMRGAKQGTGNLTDQKAKFIAMDIMDYGNAVSKAFQKLLQKGCSENQISFQHASWGNASWYQNNNAPGDNSCHIFNASGGGINWKEFPEIKYDFNYGYPWFATGNAGGSYSVANFGTNNRYDLYLRIEHRSNLRKFSDAMKVCKQINKIAGVPPYSGNYNELPNSFYSGAFNTRFKGVFPDKNPATSAGSDLAPYPAFCVGAAGWLFIIIPIYVR